MLESVFMIMVGMAFILFILGVESKSMIYSMMSTMLWTITMITAHYIQVPGDTSYADLGFSGLCLAFIFTNIVWLIMMNARTKERKRFRL